MIGLSDGSQYESDKDLSVERMTQLRAEGTAELKERMNSDSGPVYTDPQDMRAAQRISDSVPQPHGADTNLGTPIVPSGSFQKVSSGDITSPHMEDAHAALNLNPEEKGLYQRHLTNLNGPGGIDNPDGTRSTLLNATIERDGKFYNTPMVWGGKIATPQEADDNIVKEGLNKFPSYKSSEEAKARYDAMHKYMERDTEAYQTRRVSDASKDLDKRTPPPLPIVPSHSIAPHNPNPPGGGPYTIKPGERLSALGEETQNKEGLILQPMEYGEHGSEARLYDAYRKQLQMPNGEARDRVIQSIIEGAKARGDTLDGKPIETPEQVEEYFRRTPQSKAGKSRVTMSDETPDEIKAGQQTADARTLRERLRSISTGAGSTLHSLSPDAREIVKAIDPMMKPGSPGGGSRIPQLKLKEYDPKELKVFGPLTSTYGSKYSFQFVGEDNKTYGVLHVTPREYNKSLHVDFVQATDPHDPHQYSFGKNSGFASEMPMGYMLQILRQLKERFPDSTSVEGFRISGALSGKMDRYDNKARAWKAENPRGHDESTQDYVKRREDAIGRYPSSMQRIPLPELD